MQFLMLFFRILFRIIFFLIWKEFLLQVFIRVAFLCNILRPFCRWTVCSTICNDYSICWYVDSSGFFPTIFFSTEKISQSNITKLPKLNKKNFYI